MDQGISAARQFGTFGQLVEAISSLSAGSGLEIVVNLALMGAFSAAGFYAGRWVARRSVAAAWVASAVAGLAFVQGADARFFVVNAGIAYLAFLYPVWRESYRRLADGLPSRWP